jgi:small subunit ribosomal protein S6
LCKGHALRAGFAGPTLKPERRAFMRHYEIIYIVNPNLNSDEYREVLKKYSEIIANNKGVVIKTEEWGKQRLAYRIRKFYNGVYVYVEFCALANSIVELERNLKLDDNILKFQTVKLADQADPEELIQKAQIEVKPTEQPLKVNDDADGQDYYDQEESEVENGEE